MVQPVQPLTSTQEFAAVKDELGEMFAKYVVTIPPASVGEKYQGLAKGIAWRLERDLLPKWTPDTDTILMNLYSFQATESFTAWENKGEKRFFNVDIAVAPLKMGQQKFIIAAHSGGTVFITTNPFAAKVQGADETKRALLEWMKNYFVRVPREAAVTAKQDGANFRITSLDNVPEEPELSSFVSPRYLVFVFPLYLKGQRRPPVIIPSDKWIEYENTIMSGVEPYFNPSEPKPAFAYALDKQANPVEAATLFQELTGLDRTFVSSPAPDATIAKEKLSGISNAFWYRLKDVFQTKYIPSPAFIGEHGIFARNVEVGEAQKSDLVYLPVRFWGIDKNIEQAMPQYITREFRIAQTGDKIIISAALPEAFDLKDETGASEAVIQFMKQWMAWAPEAKDLIFEKTENGYSARLARKAREKKIFDEFRAVVTPHVISVSFRKPSPDYAATPNATLDQWFATEK